MDQKKNKHVDDEKKGFDMFLVSKFEKPKVRTKSTGN